MWFTESRRDTATLQNENQDPGFLASSPELLPGVQAALGGENAAPLLIPPYSAEREEVALWPCPQRSLMQGSHLLLCFWDHKSSFPKDARRLPAVPKLMCRQLSSTLPSPLHASSLPHGLWVLS